MKPLAPESNHQNQKDNYKYSQRSVMWQTACAAFCSNSTRASPSLLLTYFSPATHLISHLRRNDTFSADRELFFRPPLSPKLTSTFEVNVKSVMAPDWAAKQAIGQSESKVRSNCLRWEGTSGVDQAIVNEVHVIIWCKFESYINENIYSDLWLFVAFVEKNLI